MTAVVLDGLPVRHGVPLADRTTLRVGGPARDLVEVTSTEQLVEVVRALDAAGEPVLVLGGGSNLLVGDAGFDGTVVAVATMARIIESAEGGKKSQSFDITRWAGKQSGRVSRALCEAAAFAAEEISSRTIGVITESGLMAHRLSALRPEQRIVAITSDRNVQNVLSLVWGVESLFQAQCDNTDELMKVCERTLVEAGASRVEFGTPQGRLDLLCDRVLPELRGT